MDKEGKAIAATFGIDADIGELSAWTAALRKALSEAPEWIDQIHQELLRSETAPSTVERIVAADETLGSLESELGRIMHEVDDRPIAALRTDLDEAVDALDDLPPFLQCLSEIAAAGEALGRALRTVPLTLPELEAAIAEKSLEGAYLAEREVRRFSGETLRRHVARLEEAYQEWLGSNAVEIRRLAQRRFHENVQKASLPAAKLEPQEKEFKKCYSRGRRELEHEFGKSMR